MPVIMENSPGEPGIWYLRYLYSETPVVRIVELIGGGCVVTFLRGACPPGPYYAASRQQAWKHAGRWMASREHLLQGTLITKHPENAHKPRAWADLPEPIAKEVLR